MDKNNVTTEVWHGHTLKEVREALQQFLAELQAAIGESASIEIIDRSDSDRADAALSAHMGKALRALIDQRATLVDGLDGRILQMRMPAVVLASMEGYNEGNGGNYTPAIGDTYYSLVNNVPTIRYRANNGGYYDQEPDPRLLYCNALTGKVYRWNPASSNERWIEVSTAAGKADLAESTILKPSQWPKAVLKNIADTMLDDLAVGEVYYDSGRLYLHKSSTMNVDLGEPQEGTVYCHESTGNLYRWNKSGKKWVQVGGSGSSGGVTAAIEGTGIILGGSSGGGSSPAPYISPAIGVFTIDLNAFDITEGKLEKEDGHYSDEQYEMMYRNAKGFTDAFQYAYENGYSKVVIPKGDYCFTPIFNYRENATSPYDDLILDTHAPIIWILNMSNLDIDMGGSTFHLLVDSTEHSKYYRATNRTNDLPTYSYHCAVIAIGQSRDITIRNGNFRGDWYSRTLDGNYNFSTSSNEVNQEGCYGISTGYSGFTYNINFIDLDGSGFSGDFIVTWAYSRKYFKQPFWDKSLDLGSGHSDMLVIQPYGVSGVMNCGFHFEYDDTLGTTKKVLASETDVNYGLSGVYGIVSRYDESAFSGNDYAINEASNREYSIVHADNHFVGNCYCPLIQVLTYATKPSAADTLPLRIIKTSYYGSFKLFERERYIRLQLLYEDGLAVGSYRGSLYSSSATDAEKLAAVNNHFGTSLESLPTAVSGGEDFEGEGLNLALVPKVNGMMLIEGCRIHDNARGGISGGANDVVIRRCEFMKQQYSGTSSAQGSLPVYTAGGNTNYHIDYEDSVANCVTVEDCVFYSGRYTGKLIFKHVFNIIFRNNLCYGCSPSVGNNLYTDVSGNRFYGAGLIDTMKDTWSFGSTASASKKRMTRVMNYAGNSYYRCSYPGYSSDVNTVQRVKDCYIELDNNQDTAFDATSGILQPFISGIVQDCTFDGCHIKFMRSGVETRAYFPHLKNCKIEGGISWYVSRIEDCELVDSSFNILHNLNNTDGTSAHLFIKNVKGLDLRSRAYPFQTAYLTAAGYQGNALDYVLHYEGCEISTDRSSGHLFSYYDDQERSYNDIILEFKDCRFVGSPCSRSNFASWSGHDTYVKFDKCFFDIDGNKLFDGNVSTTNRYFEFKDCRFSTDGFKLSTDVDLVCGGDSGSTSNRPKLTAKGSMYYDTSLNKPVWRVTDPLDLASMVGSNPTAVVFKDASGTTV